VILLSSLALEPVGSAFPLRRAVSAVEKPQIVSLFGGSFTDLMKHDISSEQKDQFF